MVFQNSVSAALAIHCCSIPVRTNRCRQTVHARDCALAGLGFAADAAPAPNAAEPTQPLCRDARAGVPKQLSKRARRGTHALRARGNAWWHKCTSPATFKWLINSVCNQLFGRNAERARRKNCARHLDVLRTASG